MSDEFTSMSRMEGAGAHASSAYTQIRLSMEVVPKVWLVPLPFFSHVLSFTNLARVLAALGLSIKLFVSKNDLQRIRTSHRQILDDWEHDGLDIELRELEVPGLALADGLGSAERYLEPFLKAEQAFAHILKTESETESRPTCVITDSWMPASREIATQLKVPCWTFCPFMCSYPASIIYISRLESSGFLKLLDSVDERLKQEVVSLPGLSLMRWCEVSQEIWNDNPILCLQKRNGPSLLQSDVILMSGFQELEPTQYREFDKLLKLYAVKKEQHIWHIGPTIPNMFRGNTSGVDRACADEEHPSINFLDSQPPASVVFVAFGVDVNHSREQILEIAHALEDSQQPFLCVLHPLRKNSDSDLETDDIFLCIPQELVEQTRGRGLFVQNWAPQMKVLAHPSTGAFMSHCGWNSIMESVCHGVPILAWPCVNEQFMNCRFLVDEAQLAIEVCPDMKPDSSLQGLNLSHVDRKDIERSIKTMFQTEEGAALRKRALEMKRKAEEAVGENGSSTRNLRSLLDRLQSLAVGNLEKV